MKKRIALVFDFDDTLAHDTTTALLRYLGIDPYRFWEIENKAMLDDGWDPVPSYMHQLIERSKAQANDAGITATTLRKVGKQIAFFPGVTRLFSNVRALVEKIAPDFEIRFFVVSSGIGDVLRATKIASHFDDIFSSEFAYDAQGRIAAAKKIVSFTDKTRYIFQISKGIFGDEYRDKPFEVNKKVPQSELYVELSNMIYIGDGFTDIPCFSLMNKNSGHAIAVYDPNNAQKQLKSWKFVEDGRVRNLHSANYSTHSDLFRTIEMAISSIVYKTNQGYRG